MKQIVISIIIGACVAFFSTLFQGLADFFKDHATNMISGGASAFYYAAKHFTKA